MLKAPGNQLAFTLRSRLRWSRGPAVLPDEPKHGLFDWLEGPARAAALQRAHALEGRYDLGALRARSTRLVYAENLALLDRLEALVGDGPVPVAADGTLRAVDVGCGVFQYATALQRWLVRGGVGAARAVRLTGIEIDGYGVYPDGHSRADHAAAHAALAGAGTSFRVADVTRQSLASVDVATLFYPFLSAYPLLRWGSPLSHLRPRRLLAATVAALRPGGLLVVANQTEAEFERLQGLLAEAPVALRRRVPFASDLVPYGERTAGRIGSAWVREETLPAGPVPR
jgi:SAM-dependent methyltransferase